MPQVQITHTPQELAELFGALNDHQQAEFFNHLAVYCEREFHGGEPGFASQMESVRHAMADQPQDVARPVLNHRGMAIMKMIGGDY